MVWNMSKVLTNNSFFADKVLLRVRNLPDKKSRRKKMKNEQQEIEFDCEKDLPAKQRNISKNNRCRVRGMKIMKLY